MVSADHSHAAEQSVQRDVEDFFRRVTVEIQSRCETATRKYSFDFAEGQPIDNPASRFQWEVSDLPAPAAMGRLTLASLSTAETLELPDLSCELGKISLQMQAEAQPTGDSDVTEDPE